MSKTLRCPLCGEDISGVELFTAHIRTVHADRCVTRKPVRKVKRYAR